MRVCTGRFLRVQSGNPCHHLKAGYVTLPPEYDFTFNRCYAISETEASLSALTKVQAFNRIPSITMGVWLLCRLLTSYRELVPHKFMPMLGVHKANALGQFKALSSNLNDRKKVGSLYQERAGE